MLEYRLLAVLIWVPAAGGLSSCRACESEPGSTDGLEDGWRSAFHHEVIDPDPPATYRINDLRVGDIDGDGHLDIWASGRGAGDDAYQMLWYRNPDWKPHRIARGDFKYGNLGDIDGDGDLDVVVDAQWFENPGLGVPGDWSRHPFGHRHVPDLVHVSDMDGDGRLDVIFTTKHRLFWLRGPEDPRQPWRLLEIASDAGRRTGGALADIDGDGDLDVLWGNAWFEQPEDPRGDPWPRHVVDADWPSEARGAVGDLDRDGRLDLVLSGEESGHGVAWYRATSRAGHTAWTRLPIADRRYTGVHSLELADFDGDGDLDVFAAEMNTGSYPHLVSVFENADARGGRWTEHVIATTGSHNAKVADLDDDGAPEIIGKNFQAGSGRLQIELWRNQLRSRMPLDRWKRHVIDTERSWRSVFVDAGDLDGDGAPDIVTGGWWYRNPGRIAGRWERRLVGAKLNNMAALHDFDGDGLLDVLGTAGKPESNLFFLARNEGDGAFDVTPVGKAEGDFLQGARVGGITKGGKLWVALSWHRADTVQTLTPTPDLAGPWEWEAISSHTTGEQLALGDLNGDGEVDIHLGTHWLRNERGSWRRIEAVRLTNSAADPDRVELADLDGDGDDDVVIGCEHASYLVWGEQGSEPTEPWTEHVIARGGGYFMSLDVADLDGDDDPDIVVGEHSPRSGDEGRVLLFENRNDARSWRQYVIDSGLEHHDGTRLVDLDQDGDLDIVSIGWNHGKTIVYENLALSP